LTLATVQEIKQHIVDMNEEILQIRSLLSGLMEVPLRSPVVLKFVFNSCIVSLRLGSSRVKVFSWVTRIPSSCIISGAERKCRRVQEAIESKS
jgi:hypothetical protein